MIVQKLLFVVVCGLCGSLAAQDTIALIRLRTSDLYPAMTRPSHKAELYMFSVNHRPPQPIGLLGEHLEPHLRAQPVAHRMFLDYRKKARTRGALTRISFFTVWAGVAVVLADNWISPADNTMSTVGLSLTYAGLGGGIVSLLMQPGINRRLEHAVDVYNAIE